MLTLSAKDERHPAAMHGGENVVGPTKADFQSDRKNSSAMGDESCGRNDRNTTQWIKCK
jgi:hypothetical protein